VQARETGGMVDILMRAQDRATAIQAMQEQGWLDADQSTAPGVDISWIGPVAVVPATYDTNGDIVTPAIMDNRDHANIRLSGTALTVPSHVTPGELQWVEALVMWATAGTPDPVINKAETAQLYTVTGLVEPDTVASPVNVWA